MRFAKNTQVKKEVPQTGPITSTDRKKKESGGRLVVLVAEQISHNKYGHRVGLCLFILDKMEWSEQSHKNSIILEETKKSWIELAVKLFGR